jgi:hypothetical protein
VTVGANSGNISVTANNTCGSSAAQTLSVTVYNTVPSKPDSISGNAFVCPGSTQTYSVAPVSGATSYSWTLPGGWSGTSTTNTITTTVGNSGGLISVLANGVCGKSPAQYLFVTVNPVPAQPGSISGDTTVCVGSVQTYSVAPVTGATSYTWSLPGGWTGTSTTNTINLTVGSNGGVIVVTADNICGSSNPQYLLVSVVNSPPSQPGIISGNTNVCVGSLQTYSVAPVSGATSYTWTLPSGWSGTSSTNTINVAVGNNGGAILVAANGACGNSPAQTINVTVKPLPNIGVTNSSGTLTANQAGATYQWIDCNNNNAPISGATNQSFTPATGGSYAVVVTWNGCSDTSACQTVTITGLDKQTSSKLSFSIYPNPNRGSFTIQTEKAGVFELIDVTGKVINTYTLTNTQQTVQENLPAGMYFVREKDSGSVHKLIIE